MRQKQIRDYVLEARLQKEKYLNRKFESFQKNEDTFKPAIDERTLLKNIETSLSWMQILLKDMKRKLEPKWKEYWDSDDIKDEIEDIETVIKLMTGWKKELLS